MTQEIDQFETTGKTPRADKGDERPSKSLASIGLLALAIFSLPCALLVGVVFVNPVLAILIAGAGFGCGLTSIHLFKDKGRSL